MNTTKASRWLSAMFSLCLLLAVADNSFAQQPAEQQPDQGVAPEQVNPPAVDYDSEPPYTYYEQQWNRRFPAPYRRAFRQEYYPYGRPYYPRQYWTGRAPTVYEPYGEYRDDQYVFDDGYTEGFHDGRRFQKWQTKAELGRNGYLRAMRTGSEQFRKGDYGTAARQFIMAAELNQGDAASRLHAVHALTALGQYSAAVPALRRALQLQPKLVYLPLDIRTEYGQQKDFDAHLQKLAQAASEVNDDAGLWLLLGYCQFFSGAGADAHHSLSKAAELAPEDTAVTKLLDATQLSTPQEPPATAPPASATEQST